MQARQLLSHTRPYTMLLSMFLFPLDVTFLNFTLLLSLSSTAAKGKVSASQL